MNFFFLDSRYLYIINLEYFYKIIKIILRFPKSSSRYFAVGLFQKTCLCIETDNISGYIYRPFSLPKWLVGSRRFSNQFSIIKFCVEHVGEKCQIIVGETGARNCCFIKNHLGTRNLATSPSKFHLRSIHTGYLGKGVDVGISMCVCVILRLK